MIARFFLILGSLIAIGMVGVFLLFVSALSLLTTIVAGIGLMATFILGYWAGSLPVISASKTKRPQKLSVINAPADIIYFSDLTGAKQAQADSLAEELCEVTPIR